MRKYREGALVVVAGPPPTWLNCDKVSSESAVSEFGGALWPGPFGVNREEVSSGSPCRRGWASTNLADLRQSLERERRSCVQGGARALWPGPLGVTCEEVSSGSPCRRGWDSAKLTELRASLERERRSCVSRPLWPSPLGVNCEEVSSESALPQFGGLSGASLARASRSKF